MGEPSRWENSGVARGNDYDARWRELAATGVAIHGEADLVDVLATEFVVSKTVLDAGCGTGRVAIELARRGYTAVGIDQDAAMLDSAKAKAPELEWIHADLSTFSSDQNFGLVVLAGNVMIFLEQGTEARAVAHMAKQLEVGGLLIAGFQLRAGGLQVSEYDDFCSLVGLSFERRYSTWDREPFTGGDYVVSVHRLE